MRHQTRASLGVAAFALVFASGAFVLPALSDPTPSAEAQNAQLADAKNLRGRAEHIAASMTAASAIRVIDGDTLEDTAADVTYRIVNIDTPETGSRARCPAERELGDRATRQARALVAASTQLELRATGRIDRYGRTIAFVVIDGADLGETLIADGLARPWRGRREPWCDAAGNLIP